LRAKKTSRETAVAEMARRYAEFVHVLRRHAPLKLKS
jgi:hypothetical protein